MIKVFIGNATTEEDYTRYVVHQSIRISKSLNVPTTCALSMTNVDNAFVMPALRSYIRIVSTKYNRTLFSGFLTNDPGRQFLGVTSRSGFKGQQYVFQMQFTSDEYLLNIKSVNFIPTFVNQTSGHILRVIAETLCPNFYDFTYCADGDLIPSYTYDPTKSWSEIAKEFCDGRRYRYSCVDKQIHFQPYGDGDLGISYDETKGQGTFDPYSLATSATTTAIVNDVTVIGAQEAGNSHEDHFIGTGFNGAFGLKHKVFGLASGQGGSSILLSDSWNGTSLNAQNWNAQDPSQNLYYGTDNTQSLNILTGVQQPKGSSFIAAHNALELAGGVVLQHGEFVFNDSSYGNIGGVYRSEILNDFNQLTIDENSCEAAFAVVPTTAVKVTASGAAGILIQPFRKGAVPAKATGFNLVTKENCTYTLTTSISAPAPSRYTQTFRTLGGVAYGGDVSSDLLSSITWTAVETNIFSGVQTKWTYTESEVLLPATAVYVLIDNYQLNLTVNTTVLSVPVPGALNCTCEIGAGLLAPIYISGNVQYTGAFVTPSGGNLPIKPDAFGPENNFPLGTSLQNQAAELDSGQVVDTLNFYGDDMPGVGVRIRLQTWESQAAVARVQDPTSIELEAAVVGDDGIRSSIVSNMNPLPRTSEDCDAAGAAFLADRTQPYYQGTYKAMQLFFKPSSDDIEFYPACARYFKVNCPQRGIDKQQFLVTKVDIALIELTDEIIQFGITFGPDLYLEKLLAALVPLPTEVLTATDASIQPTPQALASLGTNYLSDVSATTANSLAISGAAFKLTLKDTIPDGAWYEIRNADMNWGLDDGRLITKSFFTGDIYLNRYAYDQNWYIRLVKNIDGKIISSRRTKVVRVVYPRVPLQPAYVRADSSEIYVDFNGDVRNIEGIELRGNQLAWTPNTVYHVGQELYDGNNNTQIVVGTASAHITGYQVTTTNIVTFEHQIDFFLDAPLSQTGQMYNGQTATFSNLPVEFAYVPADNIIRVVNDTTLRIITYGPFLSFNSTADATVVSHATIPGGRSGGSEPSWNVNAVGATGSVITQDGDIVWANLGNVLIPDTQTTYYEAIVGSEFDMDLKLDILRGVLSPGQTGQGPIGQFQIGRVPAKARNFTVYFFNLMWEYGPGLDIVIPPPQPPTLRVGYSFGSALQLLVDKNDPTTRTDIKYTQLQISNNINFDTLLVDVQTAGSPGTLTVNVPVTGGLYARALLADYISSGGWSTPLAVPQGFLLASDYLAGQGSAPPAITNSLNTSGGLFTYTSTDQQITMASVAFGVIYPNGVIDEVPAKTQTFIAPQDAVGFEPSTLYGFFPSLLGPTTPNPEVEFNGPYLNYTTTGAVEALKAQMADGSVPITNGYFEVTTAAPGGTAGGAGGGTGGGGNCGEVTRKILCSDGVRRELKDISVGQLVVNIAGRLSRVVARYMFLEETVTYKTRSGLETETAYGHVLCSKGKWKSLASLVDLDEVRDITVLTDNGEDSIVELILGDEPRYICKIALEPVDKKNASDDDHTYNLDGFWSHNVIVKNGV